MGESRTQRLAPGQRRALLITAAEEVFANRGYTQAGLAEVASIAGVSKTLLYHYFPEGRPELYGEVMERLVGEVVDVLQRAVGAPTSPERRLERLVAALVVHFQENPEAYRLLVLEPWGSGDPTVVGKAMAVRSRMAGEVNRLLAPAGAALPVTLAGGAAVMGAVLQVCELAMTGQITGDQAVGLTQRFVRGGLAALDLL